MNLQDKWTHEKVLNEQNKEAMIKQQEIYNNAADALELQNLIFSTLGIRILITPGKSAFMMWDRMEVEFYKTGQGLCCRFNPVETHVKWNDNYIYIYDIRSMMFLSNKIEEEISIYKGHATILDHRPGVQKTGTQATVKSLKEKGEWKL